MVMLLQIPQTAKKKIKQPNYVIYALIPTIIILKECAQNNSNILPNIMYIIIKLNYSTMF